MLVRYNDYIALNNSKSQIEFLLRESYGVDLQIDAPKYKGKISDLKRHLGFAFIISSDGASLYANKRVFKPDTWLAIRNDDEVYFDIGTNNLGDCAINVIIA